MLDQGKDLDWFNSNTIIAFALVAVIGFVIFVIWELTAKHPVVDLSLFSKRNFAGGTIALSVGFGLYFGNLVLLPLWLQTTLGYTPTDAGLALAPIGLFSILLSPVAGKFLPKIDPRKMATASFLFFATCFWLRSRYTVSIDTWGLAVPTLIQGIAMAGLFIPLMSIILSGLPGNRIAAASGLSNFVRIMCGGIGSSVMTTAWDHRSILHHAQLSEQANIYNPIFNQSIEQMQNLGLSLQASYGWFNQALNQQAAMLGINDMFYVSSGIFVALIGLIWITRPERGDSSTAAAAAAAH
jgi:DHA2 family multidrug resistance protein